jgi:hypothetical protein
MKKIKQVLTSKKAVLIYKHLGITLLILLIVSVMQTLTKSDFWLVFLGFFLGRQNVLFTQNWEKIGKEK